MDRLLQEVEVIEAHGDPDAIDITAIEFDSRQVAPGALFCCLPGASGDGHDHAGEAVARGAAALLVEKLVPLDVPQVLVRTGAARGTMARLACAFYGHPDRALLTVGVTGTNGKTTVTQLLASVFEANGWPSSVIGTLDGALTTPESTELQRALAEARDHGRRAVVLEVSSHALSQARVDGMRFSAAAFTNLSHDHLDYHGTMESYFEAKASLFTPSRAEQAVVNEDDPWGRRLLERVAIPAVRYGSEDVDAVESSPRRIAFTWRGHRVELALTGSFQVANALAAAATAAAMGVPTDAIVAGLAQARPVPGRFEVVETSAPFTVIVDYAHTPDGLRVALRSARQLAAGRRVVCVFGCGGDRDHAKRPIMGKVATEGADAVVLTSDNPRHEDPDAIAEEVLSGVLERAAVTVRLDRAQALELAVEIAAPGDVVVVAGKGHEQAIEIGGRRLPFDDRRRVADAVARRFGHVAAVSEPRP
jgi:UDP-N-acetylmuramoyl-L-alanyl-D-glutamate--2,6-diaminopimelate ligase